MSEEERTTLPAPDPSATGESIVLALGPSGEGPRRTHLRDALAWALTGALGRPVEVQAFNSYPDLRAALDRVHFAWLPPAVYVRTRSSLELVGALQRTGTGSYHGVLFTRDDHSEVQTVRDLPGRSVAWVHADSAAGHLFPRLLLRETGILSSHLGEQRWAGSHDAVVHAVASGAVEVGATYAHFDEHGDLVRAAWMESPTRDMRVVGTSHPIPSDVLCATSQGMVLASRFRTAMRSLATHGSGQGLLGALFGTYRIADTDPSSYDVVGAALASVLEL